MLKYWRISDSLDNFGDVLSFYLAKRLTDINQGSLEGKESKTSTWLIGSVIDDWLFKPQVGGQSSEIDHVFWSCGLRRAVPPNSYNLSRSLFLAVRGPLTKTVLGLPSNTPIGDFGLLTSIAYPELSNTVKLGVTLLVPHYSDPRSDEELKNATGVDKVLRPEINGGEQEVKEIIRAIANADFVLCGALHAAIVAASYNVPFAFWDSGRIDIPFKWDDFAQSVGIECVFAKTLAEGCDIYTESQSTLLLPSLSSLLATCPFMPKQEAVLAAFELDLKNHQIDYLIRKFLDASRSFSDNLLILVESLKSATNKELDATKLELDATKLELGYSLLRLPRILRRNKFVAEN